MAKPTVKKTPGKSAKTAARPVAKKTAASKTSARKTVARRPAVEPTLEQKIRQVLKGGPKPRLAALATVTAEGNPWVRIMVVHPDGLTLYSSTSLDSRKVSHIRHNPNVALTISKNPANLMSPYVVIDASVEILTDEQTKLARWSKNLARYFKGPDDPNYCVLKYSPRTIEYMGGKHPDILEVK